MRYAAKLAAAKRKTLIVGVSVALIIAAAIAWGVAGFIAQQQVAYAAAIHRSAANVQAILRADNTTITELIKKPDSQGLYTALTSTGQHMEDGSHALPALPQIVGISLASDKDRRNQENLQYHFKTFASAITAAKVSVQYKSQVFAALEPAMGQKVTTATQLTTVASQWTTACHTLKGIRPPATAEQVHAQLYKACQAIRASLAQLPVLTAAHNTAGFVAQRRLINSKIAKLDTTSDVFAILTNEAQKVLTTQIVGLQDALSL